jgi:hypothetical protein
MAKVENMIYVPDLIPRGIEKERENEMERKMTGENRRVG